MTGCVLTYHDISDDAWSVYTVPPARLKEQVALLRDAGVEVLTLEELLRRHREGKGRDGPQRPAVVLTFDDGFASVATIAAPLLAGAGLPATVFAISGFLGRKRYLWPQQLRDLHGAGWGVGSHSVSHPNLRSLLPGDVLRQWADSRKALEDLLGGPVPDAALPGGRGGPMVRTAAAAAGYRSLSVSEVGSRPRTVLLPAEALEALRVRADPLAFPLPVGAGGDALGPRQQQEARLPVPLIEVPRVAIRGSTDRKTFLRILRQDPAYYLRARVHRGLLEGARRLLGDRLYDDLRAAVLGERP